MIFLGAGASTSYGIPTTSILTKEIRDLLSKSNQDLLEKIDSDFHNQTPEDTPNYEEILAYLTVLTNPAEIRRDHYARGFPRRYPQFTDKQSYLQAIDEIQRIVCNHCNEPFVQGTERYLLPENLESTFQLTYDAIIGTYLSMGKQQLILSTNYDPSLEIWCQKRNINCVDGSQNLSNLEVKKLKDETSLIADTEKQFTQLSTGGNQTQTDRVGLIRMHGSVWTYDVRNKLRIKFTSPPDRRMFSDLYEDIMKKKPVLIFPGKEDMVNVGNWDILYQYFKRMLNGDCLFIGCSFRHETITSPVIDYLRNGKIAKLGILSPHPEEVLANLSKGETLPKERIVLMSGHLGTRDAIQELVRKWFLPTIPSFPFANDYELLQNLKVWKNQKEQEYIR